MNNLRFMVLGYLIAVCLNGCELGMTNSNNEIDIPFETNCSGLGSNYLNPVYVKIVE